MRRINSLFQVISICTVGHAGSSSLLVTEDSSSKSSQTIGQSKDECISKRSSVNTNEGWELADP